MKHHSPTGRWNYGRPLKRLLDTWDRNGSTSGPNPWQRYDDDDDDDDDDNNNNNNNNNNKLLEFLLGHFWFFDYIKTFLIFFDRASLVKMVKKKAN